MLLFVVVVVCFLFYFIFLSIRPDIHCENLEPESSSEKDIY